MSNSFSLFGRNLSFQEISRDDYDYSLILSFVYFECIMIPIVFRKLMKLGDNESRTHVGAFQQSWERGQRPSGGGVEREGGPCDRHNVEVPRCVEAQA